MALPECVCGIKWNPAPLLRIPNVRCGAKKLECPVLLRNVFGTDGAPPSSSSELTGGGGSSFFAKEASLLLLASSSSLLLLLSSSSSMTGTGGLSWDGLLLFLAMMILFSFSGKEVGK